MRKGMSNKAEKTPKADSSNKDAPPRIVATGKLTIVKSETNEKE